MSTTVAPVSWPRAAGTAPVARRIGAAAPDRTGGVDAAAPIGWVLTRNCSIRPSQMLAVYLGLSAVCLSIAIGFAAAGAVPVLAFAGLELLLVGVALLVYARHAADRECIALDGGALVLEHQTASRVERTEFSMAWVRVEPPSGQCPLIRLTGDGRTALAGRYLRPELRPRLAAELRAALRAQREPA